MGAEGVDLAALAARLGIERGALVEIASGLGAVRVGEDLAVASEAFDALQTALVDALERFHAEYPLRKGLDAGSLANALRAKAEPAIVQHALAELLAQQRVQRVDGLFRIHGYDPFARLGSRERQLVCDLERAFRAGGLQPPSPAALVGTGKAERVLYALLLETGRLVRLKTYDRSRQIVLHADTIEDVKQALVRRFPYPAPFAVKDVRDLLQSTRRHVVPIMEHLDAIGTTVRNGDLRRLREP
jgi:selenocysteine-specific elongation factor